MQLIPAVDVLDGKVVRLLRGDYEQATEYGERPTAALAMWRDAGARLVHVVDLAGARSGVPDRALWASLGSTGIRLQVGGGIRTVELAADAVAAGIDRVVMGTAAVWEPEILADTVAAVGELRVVAALDVRDGRATGAGWLDAGRLLEDVVGNVVQAGVRTVLVTGIQRDGTMDGPDLQVLDSVREAGPELELLGSGGVGQLDDLDALADAGCAGAIVGRALYEGRFTFGEATAHLASRQA